ncbi:hypothetical protein DY000_02010587 [Brassica cretica]|uniref:Uncharacterized protein n=1 Tax=Brassica cretica TaxID=69181 RepID=A0ABQ7C9Z9_BRACR|nr:hypothetical protein DY000_02010587 [Brassica cretica]
MAHSDSPSGNESPPNEAAPTAAAFADTKLERMAQQDAVQKATNEQLAAIAAILAPLDGNSEDPATTVRKQLFDTYQTAVGHKICSAYILASLSTDSNAVSSIDSPSSSRQLPPARQTDHSSVNRTYMMLIDLKPVALES